MTFAAVYGLISLYIWHFTNNDTSLTLFFGGEAGLIMSVLSVALWLAGPLLILVILAFVLTAILPGEIGVYIFGFGVVIACAGCVISDIVHIIQLFKPDFLGGNPGSGAPDGNNTQDGGDAN